MTDDLDQNANRCPCLSGENYGSCCGRIHEGNLEAATAEQLMRSRFSAFALGERDYLMRSWHSSTRPAELELDHEVRWYRLDILESQGGLLDTVGIVDFAAYYRGPEGAGVQRERSRFVREGGRWVYLDGGE